jgi:hypothetical protein
MAGLSAFMRDGGFGACLGVEVALAVQWVHGTMSGGITHDD